MKITLNWNKTHKRNLVFFAFIAITGVCLRLYRLDFPELWNDELHTFVRVNGDMAHTLGTLTKSPFPPLYYIIMNLWCQIFGYSEFSLRFPSMVFSSLSVVFIYFLAKAMFSEREGIIAALLLCVSSFSINYAQEAKMYAMVWCLSILSFLYFFSYIRSRDRRHLVLYVVFTTATVYTLYLGFVFILIQNILFFCLYRKQILKWLTANLIILLCYLPWWFTAINNISNKTGITWVPQKDYLTFFPQFFKLVSGIKIGVTVPFEGWVLLALVFIAFILMVTQIKIEGLTIQVKNYIALFTWLTISLLIFIIIDKFFTPILVPRYLGFIHIPLILLFSIGISAIDRINLRGVANLIFLLLIASSVFFHVIPFHKQGLKIDRDPWAKTIFKLCKVTDENSILFMSRRSKKAFDYYGDCYKGKVVLIKKRKPRYDLTSNEYSSIVFLYRDLKGLKKIRWIRDWISKYSVDQKKRKWIGIIITKTGD